MNPSSLITSKLIEYCRPLKTIVVCGYTKTGKIQIARKLSEELDNRQLIISDDYMFTDHQNALSYFMDDVLSYHRSSVPTIIEGVLSFRLLRKGITEGTFQPDLIIKTKCNEETIRYFYDKEGEKHKLTRALGFNKGLDKIWEEYQSLQYNIPVIELNTSL